MEKLPSQILVVPIPESLTSEFQYSSQEETHGTSTHWLELVTWPYPTTRRPGSAIHFAWKGGELEIFREQY